MLPCSTTAGAALNLSVESLDFRHYNQTRHELCVCVLPLESLFNQELATSTSHAHGKSTHVRSILPRYVITYTSLLYGEVHFHCGASHRKS